MPEGLQAPVEFGIEPTGTTVGCEAAMRHTGHAVPVAARPVVYRLPAASPVSPSMASGVMTSVVNVAAGGRCGRSSADRAARGARAIASAQSGATILAVMVFSSSEVRNYNRVRMRIALCNEVIAPMPFPRQCEYAAKLGYDGLEIAPYTLSDEPHRLGGAQIAAARSAAEDAGVHITGLHWLLIKPTGLSISTRDDAVRSQAVEVMPALTVPCAGRGGRVARHRAPL